MSTRQRSFFDQQQKPKYHNRPPWNYNRNGRESFRPNQNSDIPPPRTVVTGPPIMPSTETRKKLKKFQFIEGAPAASPETMPPLTDPEKENLPVESRMQKTPKVVKFGGDARKRLPDSPKLAQSKTVPPSTPATRLPLADLVGNTDHHSRNAAIPEKPSPEEQLYWRGSQSTATPMLGRKRARSSSPIGASQEETQADFVLKDESTPVDPAAELWNRYTSNKGTPASNKGVLFAHLVNESPRSSATVGSVGGFRRWASCGTEFPVSASKRRKTHGGFKKTERGQDVFGVSSSDSNVTDKPVEKSKLAALLEKMRESIARPEPRNSQSNIPSSSSPLPEKGKPGDITTGSPVHRHIGRIAEVNEDVASSPPKIDQRKQSECSSDEFGDADFDAELVEALEISQLEAPQPQLPEPEAQPKTADTMEGQEVVSGNHVGDTQLNTNETTVATAATAATAVDSDDEFGLGDDDEFAADLENVASLYDCRPVEETPVVPQTHDTSISNPAPPPVVVLDDSDDEFGDDIDLDAFAAAEVAATQGLNGHSHDARAIQRYLIKKVDEAEYADERGALRPQKVLLVEDERSKHCRVIILRQAWYDTFCTPGSFVHVIGQFSPNGQCIIDNTNNMLILHPDHLISATVVADSFGCLRRAVLQDRVKATSRASAPMLYGTLLHELFQEAIKVNRWDTEFLLDTVDKLLPSKFDTILEINSTCEQVKDHLRSKLPELQSWAEVFMRVQPTRDAVVKDRNGRSALMCVNKLLDVEEHVWSPQYGLKGNIDATVQVVMQDEKGQRTLTVPFEIKTGKNANAAHVAQTALYSLLLSNRYDVEVAFGILYYMESSEVSRIPAIRNDIIHMIIKRNELACYVRQRIELPPMLKEDFKCGKCYAQESCFAYHKLVEDGDGSLLNKKAKEKYDEFVKYLKPSDQEFMKKWDTLLTKEESDMMRFRRELWTMVSTEREQLGRCFSNVILESGSVCEETGTSKINRYTYTFIKPTREPGFSFTESQLIIGEPIVISDEKGHFALANGYVTNVRKRRITVALDRRLHNARTKLPGFDVETNQTFSGIMEVTKEGQSIQPPPVDEEPVLYRLDKDEFSNGMAAARNNLIQIMDDGVFKARDLRELIVGGRAPTFKNIPEHAVFPDTASQLSMNNDQRAAIHKVMSAKDYALVLGMPGTGKTTTIAHIIRALVAKGKSVLLTSYTHTAVDNILLKIRNDNIGILRLGAASKIHPEVRDFATLACEPKNSLEELERAWMEPPVVATTCLTIGHPLFNRRIFDYCIVDEASQITLPVCLGPIRMAHTFVLVGDHYQLPPLVQNKEAAAEGLDISLFKLLCEQHPQSVVSLEHQYRMCADVMLLSNTFIYSGRLKCGNEAVANRKLDLPNPAALMNHHYNNNPNSMPSKSVPLCSSPSTPTCWLSRALDPTSPVLFLNTDGISPALETALGSRINNTVEARLITHLSISLLSVGISASDIGVIAFYRSQLALLRSCLQSAHANTQANELSGPKSAMSGSSAAIELHTADKFQGRDKEIVLVSCVRSNENGIVGDLLKDRRRINVALTRARSKMIVVGSERTLGENELLRELVGLCREKGWVLDLQEKDLEGHAFDEGGTQWGTAGVGGLVDGSPVKASPSQRTSRKWSKRAGEDLDMMDTEMIISPSPRKRRALADITAEGSLLNEHAAALTRPRFSASQGSAASSSQGKKNKTKSPKKVIHGARKIRADKMGVMRDVLNEML